MNSVFISYRRRDSAAARWLHEIIGRTYSPVQVFLDTETIQLGDEWPMRTQKALASANLMIVIIGPDWLHIHDEHGRRRIDDPHDWVRREVSFAIENNMMIIPMLLSNSQLPKSEALPDTITPLLNYQAFQLRDETWRQDLKRLLDRLDELRFERALPEIEYPIPHVRLRELSEQEIEEAMRKLPQWKMVERPLDTFDKRRELMRVFRFASFKDAMHFMMVATRHISKVNHHPDWENIWRSITIWLSTWDIGHKPSIYDLELAEYFDRLYLDYQPAEQK